MFLRQPVDQQNGSLLRQPDLFGLIKHNALKLRIKRYPKPRLMQQYDF